jgi:hypothetical protein
LNRNQREKPVAPNRHMIAGIEALRREIAEIGWAVSLDSELVLDHVTGPS